MKRSKAYRSALANLDRSRNYSVGEALQLLKDGVQTKFDQTVDVAVNLGVDPRHADQMVRGTVNLPHGTGKQVRVLVFASGDAVDIARQASSVLFWARANSCPTPRPVPSPTKSPARSRN